MWESDSLTAHERVLAFIYARYAGKNNHSWCTWNELIKRSGIKSRATISKYLTALQAKGWLAEKDPARQHYSARYYLTTPGPQQFTSCTAESDEDTAEDEPSSSIRVPLANGSEAPAVQDVNCPAVQSLTPAVQSAYPSTQTQRSEEQPGGTLPPDPLRPEHAPRTPNDHGPNLTAVPHSNDHKRVTSQTRAGAELRRPLLALIETETPEYVIDINQLALAVDIPPLELDPERAAMWPVLQAQLARINHLKVPTQGVPA